MGGVVDRDLLDAEVTIVLADGVPDGVHAQGVPAGWQQGAGWHRDLGTADASPALWCRDASLLVDAYENGVEPLQARHSDCLAVKWASHGEPGEARSARPASEEGSQ